VAQKLFLDIGVGAAFAGTIFVTGVAILNTAATLLAIGDLIYWLESHEEWKPVDP
jgi:hypothetical protein